MRKFIGVARSILFVIVGILLMFLLGLKVYGSWVAQPLKKYWSDSGSCYISKYEPDYKMIGLVGRVLELLSSRYFYRVYTKDDELLRTSEWFFWMREGNEQVAPEFSGATVLYPGTEGWEYWTVTECR